MSSRHRGPTDRKHLGYVRNPHSLMEGTETLCHHATILTHRWFPGTRSQLLSVKRCAKIVDAPVDLLYSYARGVAQVCKIHKPISLVFSLKVRDDQGFQVNPYVVMT